MFLHNLHQRYRHINICVYIYTHIYTYIYTCSDISQYKSMYICIILLYIKFDGNQRHAAFNKRTIMCLCTLEIQTGAVPAHLSAGHQRGMYISQANQCRPFDHIDNRHVCVDFDPPRILSTNTCAHTYSCR